ncbi:sulfite reductase flavoprotein subunit alpha [Ferruginibacter sp. HRS2-29]|uniref:diflavin oxidoreductase n=1 Tax=Ferruginibacter sp. HRS2-29 TaxID=2487334 RepID=UPI0020CFE1A3|nr:flavodoxin domain-containing protein [Ferruginibacter sp. HRS2-29]MCP9751128.1 sulfite reductase [Ferruginibacter sp. HRS2-29]
MLAELKLKALTDLTALLTKEELIWANGYISGLVTDAAAPKPLPDVASGVAAKKITIAYGTETGNAKKLAVDFAAKAKKNGVNAKLVSLDQYRLNDLSREEYFVTVISTQGDGEPPIAAQKFYDHLHNNGFRIPTMKYAVLALGDTAYPMFCKTGEDVDTQLEKLGASRFYPLQKCDLDYETEADRWFEQLLSSLGNTVTVAPYAKPVVAEPAKKTTGKKIYTGTILSSIDLNARGSDKKTFHIEMVADDLDYLPGDSIGVVPENDPLIVQEILALTKIDADRMVTYKTEEFTIGELLNKKLNISFLLEKFIKQYGILAAQELPAERVDLIDLLRNYPLSDIYQYEPFILSLNAIAPRIYNIASSINAHGNEVHIIALKDEFLVKGAKQTGLCSFYFDNKKEGDEISFFIQPNKRFRLPAEDKDIIMIGPGTGIAPFRSFVAERDATGASGRNWLFFGEDDFTRNFYYQTEWQNWFGTGVLTNINLAFNNGADERVTIETKLLQKAAGLFEWISGGAYIYLCGEKDPMSKEVEAALLAVIEQEGKLTKQEAVKYFEQLKTDGRYMKDVY